LVPDAPGDFDLHGGHQALRRRVGLGQFHQHGRAGGVGQIGNEFPAAPGAVRFEVGERVSVEQLQTALAGELLFQEIEKPPVFLDGQHLRPACQQPFGQRPQSGADLQNFVARPGLRGGHDAAHLVLVVQKILSERLGQGQIALGKDFADVVQGHGAGRCLTT
jgi:hypothetical protein